MHRAHEYGIFIETVCVLMSSSSFHQFAEQRPVRTRVLPSYDKHTFPIGCTNRVVSEMMTLSCGNSKEISACKIKALQCCSRIGAEGRADWSTDLEGANLQRCNAATSSVQT